MTNKLKPNGTRIFTDKLELNSEAALHGVLDSLIDGIGVVDRNGIFVDMNESLVKLHGFERKEQLIGKKAIKFVVPTDRTMVRREMLYSYDKDIDNCVECTFIKADNTTFLGELKTRVLKNDSGELVGLVTQLREITKSRIIEEDTLIAESNFKRSLDESPLGVTIFSKKDEFLYANKEALSLFGFNSIEELEVSSPSDIFTQDSLEQHRQRIRNLEEGLPSPNNFEISIIRKNGDIKHLMVFHRDIIWRNEVCNQYSYYDITTKRESEELHKILADNSTVGVYIVQQKKLIYANAKFEKMLGYSSQELAAMRAQDFVHPDDMKYVRQCAKKMLTDDSMSSYEFRIIDKDGNIHWVLESISSIYYNGKKSIVGNITDITEQKKAVENLNYSDAALKSIHEGIYAMDNDFVITRWNSICEQLFDIKASEAIGKHIWDTLEIVEDYPDQNYDRVNVLFSKGFNQEEQVYKTKHGNIWLDVHAQAIEVDGEKRGWITILSDISERKSFEEQIRSSAEYLRLLINSMDDIVFTYDLDGRFTDFYKAPDGIEEYIEETGDHFIGKKYSEILEKDVIEKLDVVFKNLLETGESQQFEYFMTVNDRERWYDAQVSAIRNAANDIVGVLSVSREISERKNAEVALTESENRIRSLVNSMDDLVFTYDMEGRFSSFFKPPEGLDEYAERTKFEFVGKRYRDVLDKDIADKMDEAIGRLLETGEHQQFDYSMPVNDSVVWYDARVSLIRDADNEIVSILVVSRNISERKNAEIALVESEERIRSLLNSMDDLIFTYDLNGRFTPFYKITEYPEKEPDPRNFVGTTYRDFLPDNVADKMDDAFEKIKTRGGTHSFEYAMNVAGDERWFDAMVSPVKDNNRNIAAILVVSREISERKYAEMALIDSENKVRSLINSMDDMVLSINLEGMLTQFYKPSHYPSNQDIEYIGRNYRDVMPGEIAVKMEIAINRLQKYGTIQEFDYWLTVEDQYMCFNAKISPVHDIKGRITGYTVVTRDITERKHMEEVIEESAREWEATFDSISDQIYIIDNEYRILRANKEYANMIGIAPEDVIGQYCYKLVHNRNTPCPHCSVKEIKTKKQQVIKEIPATNGKHYQAVTSPIFNDDGEITSYISSVRDVSEIKKIEGQLQQSQLLASLGTMTAGIAHEVNNPLGSVLLLSELLLKDGAPEKIKKDLRVIHGEAKRAAKIMSTLLTYRSRSVTNNRRINLNRIVNKVLKIRQYRLNVLNIKVKAEIPDTPVYIKGDYSQLTQVFMNILINAEEALKDSGDGEIGFRVMTDRNWVKIEVSDNGNGIPDGILDNIFHPFFTTKKVGEGTGLGLSTCYSIITAHDGIIKAQNNSEGGASIIIELPLINSKNKSGKK